MCMMDRITIAQVGRKYTRGTGVLTGRRVRWFHMKLGMSKPMVGAQVQTMEAGLRFPICLNVHWL